MRSLPKTPWATSSMQGTVRQLNYCETCCRLFAIPCTRGAFLLPEAHRWNCYENPLFWGWFASEFAVGFSSFLLVLGEQGWHPRLMFCQPSAFSGVLKHTHQLKHPHRFSIVYWSPC